jgi:hypothetical protein
MDGWQSMANHASQQPGQKHRCPQEVVTNRSASSGHMEQVIGTPHGFSKAIGTSVPGGEIAGSIRRPKPTEFRQGFPYGADWPAIALFGSRPAMTTGRRSVSDPIRTVSAYDPAAAVNRAGVEGAEGVDSRTRTVQRSRHQVGTPGPNAPVLRKRPGRSFLRLLHSVVNSGLMRTSGGTFPGAPDAAQAARNASNCGPSRNTRCRRNASGSARRARFKAASQGRHLDAVRPKDSAGTCALHPGHHLTAAP